MDIPEIRYARSGDVHIAYQVLGDGPIDLAFRQQTHSLELRTDVSNLAEALELLDDGDDGAQQR